MMLRLPDELALEINSCMNQAVIGDVLAGSAWSFHAELSI